MRFNGIIDAFWLKMSMLVLMLFDHLYYFLFPTELRLWHYAARVVAPVFAYLLTVAMTRTRSRERYILRLYAAALFMAIGNTIIYYVTKSKVPNNIFLSLAIGASLIYCIDKVPASSHGMLWIFPCVVLSAASMFCEGQFWVPLMSVIFYYLRENKIKMCVVYIIVSGVPFILGFLSSGVLASQFFMIFSVIPILLYNGKRGLDNIFAKYFFYAFYPLHVWIIVLIKASATL